MTTKRHAMTYRCRACGRRLKFPAFTAPRNEIVNKKEIMISSSRFKQLHSGLSAIAQKVYDATPISGPWSASRIHCDDAARDGADIPQSDIDAALTGDVPAAMRALRRLDRMLAPRAAGRGVAA